MSVVVSAAPHCSRRLTSWADQDDQQRSWSLHLGRSQRIVPTPILENWHDSPVWELLDSVGQGVAVLRTIGHADHQLCGAGLDPMLSPVEGATVEHCGSRAVTVRGCHRADDAIRAIPSHEPVVLAAGPGSRTLWGRSLVQVPYGRVRTSML